jgi:hypothetical protein
MRKRFDGATGPMGGFYTSFEACQNAMRANNINKMLDEGRRVFGDDGERTKGKEYEIEEAIEAYGNGIQVKTKCGKLILIYAYDASDAKQTA